MQKALIRFTTLLATAAAGLTIAGAVQAQPMPNDHPPRMEPPHMQPHGGPQHKRKVWVPAHRERGHLVKGHYVWR